MAEAGALPSDLPAHRVAPAYAPSWFDRFTAWVDGLSVPASVFYAGLALGLVGVQLAIQWVGAGAIRLFPILYIVTIVYDLAVMHHLDIVAAQALARFRPVIAVTDAEYDDLHYRLTTLPSRPVLVATVLGVVYGLLVNATLPDEVKIRDFQFAATPLSFHFNHLMSLPIWAVVFVVLYHTGHQLRIVQQIYSRCTSVDLYVLHPLYAFSSLSAQTAIGIVFIAYTYLAAAPHAFSVANMSTFVPLLLMTAFSMVTFVYPLLGAHRLLTDERNRRLAHNGELQRAAVGELHRRIEQQDLTDMDGLNKALASLDLERSNLANISTWPWQAETFRAVLAALFFPVVVWLTQWILLRVLPA